MKKMTLLLFLAVIFSANAQREISPVLGETNKESNALFDLLYTIDVGATGSIGAQSQAGVIFFNNQYWVSTWNADTIHILDNTGAFVETITIPGVSGTRSMTTDGTDVYIGAAGTEIYQIDPATKTLIGIITVTTGSDATARMVTYDETLDGGSGGFWIGSFTSDIASVDMNGNELSVIPSATHGTTIYGGAIDNISPGGPFLWIHDQNGPDFVTQLALPGGAPTGIVYDFTADGTAAGATAVLAGGLFISDEVAAGVVSLVGLSQSDPSNLIFAVELTPILGANDNEIADVSIYPNPATSNTVTIKTSVLGDISVEVFDILGHKVIQTVVTNNELDINTLQAGVYMLKINQNGNSATKKLIVK